MKNNSPLLLAVIYGCEAVVEYLMSIMPQHELQDEECDVQKCLKYQAARGDTTQANVMPES